MTQKRQLNKDGLHSMLVEQGFEHQIFQKEINTRSLFEGELSFEKISDGISMHCSHGLEKQAARSSASINPCISMNIVFAGNIGFSLGEDRYQFTASEHNPVLFINVIGETEIFTRHLIEGQTVKKINITIDKQWLLSRCKSTNDLANVHSIFGQNSAVYCFDCSPALVELAEQLFEQKVKLELGSQLQAEHLSLQVVHECLPLLLAENLSSKSDHFVAPISANKQKSSLTTKLTKQALPQFGICKIEAALDGILLNNQLLKNVSLKEVASQLGLSISTLQRQVKEKHQVTVIEYLRNKRLDNAKKLLIIERKSIGEVSFMSGYTHVANFTTAFKKRFGVTPDKLRKEHFG
jgi:AraC-like DNA-binding protein